MDTARPGTRPPAADRTVGSDGGDPRGRCDVRAHHARHAPSADRQERGTASGARWGYRSELAAAIIVYLDLTGEHAPLADQIATAAATRASEVGSGRVGRIGAIADYEDQLASTALVGYGPFADADRYLEAGAKAHAAVQKFLAAHRKRR